MRLAVIRTVICAAVTIAAAGIVPRQWHGVSETDPVAWGATDPAWSPDGARLAFSLFGSIWQVAFRGGEARQVSSSGGYHAHPAWSPRGDLIAFVSGNPPVNWRQLGWYTGENHFHANCSGSYYQTPRDSLRWLQAEDLDLANMLASNNQGARESPR